MSTTGWPTFGYRSDWERYVRGCLDGVEENFDFDGFVDAITKCTSRGYTAKRKFWDDYGGEEKFNALMEEFDARAFEEQDASARADAGSKWFRGNVAKDEGYDEDTTWDTQQLERHGTGVLAHQWLSRNRVALLAYDARDESCLHVLIVGPDLALLSSESEPQEVHALLPASQWPKAVYRVRKLAKYRCEDTYVEGIAEDHLSDCLAWRDEVGRAGNA